VTRTQNEENIKKLCKEHQIDFELARNFITETNAYPFLMNEPSEYFLNYLKQAKVSVKYNKFFFEDFIIKSYYSNPLICKECGTRVKDAGIFVNKEKLTEKKHLCYNCSSLIKINVNVINHEELFRELCENLLINLKNNAQNIINVNIEQAESLIHDIFTYRELFPLVNFEIKLSELWNTDKQKNIRILHELETLKTTTLYGYKIEPIAVEQKRDVLTPGYIITQVPRTGNVIYCSYTTLKGQQLYSDWIQTMHISPAKQEFNRKIKINVINEILRQSSKKEKKEEKI